MGHAKANATQTLNTHTHPRGEEDELGRLGVVGLQVALRAVDQVEVLRRRRVDEPRAALPLVVWSGVWLVMCALIG